jgi:hypothetical protein
MPTDEDDRMVWLTEAHAIIDAWDRERRGEHLMSMADQAALASRIAYALQRTFEQGKESTLSGDR